MKHNRGQTLVGVLVAGAISAVVMGGILSMFKLQSKGTQNIMALGGYNDLSHSLDVLFSSPQCQTLGTGGLTLGGQPVNVVLSGTPPCVGLNPQPPYCLTIDTVSFTTAAGVANSAVVSSPANPSLAVRLLPFAISSIQMVGQGDNGTTEYPFQLIVNFTYASGQPSAGNAILPLPLTKSVMVYTTPGPPYAVTGVCYNAAGAAGAPPPTPTPTVGATPTPTPTPTAAPGACPQGERITAVNFAAQTVTCQVPYDLTQCRWVSHQDPNDNPARCTGADNDDCVCDTDEQLIGVDHYVCAGSSYYYARCHCCKLTY